jgi:hypothetical protein
MNFNLKDNENGVVAVPFPLSKEKWKHIALVQNIELIKSIKKDAAGNRICTPLPEYSNIDKKDLTWEQVDQKDVKANIKFTFVSPCGTYTFEYIIWDLDDKTLADDKLTNTRVSVNNKTLANIANALCGVLWNKVSDKHTIEDVKAVDKFTSYTQYLEYVYNFFKKFEDKYTNVKFVLNLVRNDYSKNKNDITFPSASQTNIIEKYEEGKKSTLVQDINKYSYDQREDTALAVKAKVGVSGPMKKSTTVADDDWPEE